jgi:hypothetical protein
MGFMTRPLFCALAVLILTLAVSAQTLRSENDPRNTAPTVGTGGPPGGPTGLFTIYDGQTLRSGEFTFTLAYSNFDRDPGNVDITEVPVSFQVGLSDHLELFFNTDAYRGVKVNSPTHLSSFYLPNSQLFIGPGILTSGPKIILAPTGIPGLSGTAIFRPTGSSPFVQYPFVGGSGGSINGTPFFISAPIANPNGGNFSGADVFPGQGSPFGSILPGAVLATNTVTLPTGLTITVPATFFAAPTYLPDAPFVNRLYGQSSFSTFTVGAKWRLTGPSKSFGFGFVPFYRFYADKADDFSGFNQMQRGAGPGGGIGDFGLVMFADGRLSRSVNVSANLGYILNSNPKGQFPTGEFTLLDRPDELIAGVGFDFPINKYFQPIFELRSTQYVAGRTPNALENSPVDALAGLRVFSKQFQSGPFKDWQLGISLAYRYHINQQDKNSFEGRDISTTFTVPGGPIVVPATVGSFPRNFSPSQDANGFIFQFFIGRRNERVTEIYELCLSPLAPPSRITLPCITGSNPSCSPSEDKTVRLVAVATESPTMGFPLSYEWTLKDAQGNDVKKPVIGEQSDVAWDVSDLEPGTYTATVTVDNKCEGKMHATQTASTPVVIDRCKDCCPVLTPTVTGPDEFCEAPITFTANPGIADVSSLNYNWKVSEGTISSGQGTTSIIVDVTGLRDRQITKLTATVEINAPSCPVQEAYKTSDGCPPVPPALCHRFDVYGPIAYNDEKARLDNFAIQLNMEKDATGYIVVYRGRTDANREGVYYGVGTEKHPILGDICPDFRARRAKAYLINDRQIDGNRLITVIGGGRELSTVELFLCPLGAKPPELTPTQEPPSTPCVPGGSSRNPNPAKRSTRKKSRRASN